MKNIEEVKKACCGCGACAQACPKACITMRADKEGFLVPVVDGDKCISCSLCVKTCPQVELYAGNAPLHTLAAYGKDEATREESSSGGLFTKAAEYILLKGGSVCAVALNADTHRAEFAFADTKTALQAMRGSKYVQADTKDCFSRIRALLNEKKPVLFAGCPCQVAALHKFLRGHEDGLFTLDIICHGVPSPLLFTASYHALEKKENAAVTDYRFRTKKHGWGMFFSYTAKGKTHIRHSNFDPYNFNFLHCNTYRESCYECRYAKRERTGDWTIGDYWGILQEHPEFYSEKGVSILLVNTEKGEEMKRALANEIAVCESEFERAARHNVNLKHPSMRPAVRDHIYDGLGQIPDADYVSERLKVKPGVKETLKALVPWQLKRMYQRGKKG